MKKQYHLAPEILYEIDGDGSPGPRFGLFSRGHHRAPEFKEAFEEELGEKLTVRDLLSLRHEWWRCVPYGVMHELGMISARASAFYPAEPESRGAFPVTVLYDDRQIYYPIFIVLGGAVRCVA